MKFISNMYDYFKKIDESNAHPFTLNIEERDNYKIFRYFFEIEDIEYQCVIYPNAFRIRSKDFDVDFITKGGTTKDIVGKDLSFLNSVLKTIAECIIDFINKNDIVKKIRFQSDGVREKAYVRFFRNHSYFSNFKIDDTYANSNFIEIHINKGVD